MLTIKSTMRVDSNSNYIVCEVKKLIKIFDHKIITFFYLYPLIFTILAILRVKISLHHSTNYLRRYLIFL